MTRLLILCTAQATGLVWLFVSARQTLETAVADPVAMASQPVGVLLGATVSGLAILAATWLLVGTLVDTAVAVTSAGSSVLAHGMSPVWVRRIISQAVGTALVLGTLAGPATAATQPVSDAATAALSPDFTPPRVVAPAPDGASLATVGTLPPQVSSVSLTDPLLPPVQSVPEPPGDPAVPEGQAEEAGPLVQSEAPDTPVDAPVAEGTHTVATGENLWVIARGHLSQDGQAPPTDRQVHAFWVRLIEANTAGLRSGDPDLIFAGEVLVLPTLEHPGE